MGKYRYNTILIPLDWKLKIEIILGEKAHHYYLIKKEIIPPDLFSIKIKIDDENLKRLLQKLGSKGIAYHCETVFNKTKTNVEQLRFEKGGQTQKSCGKSVLSWEWQVQLGKEFRLWQVLRA